MNRFRNVVVTLAGIVLGGIVIALVENLAHGRLAGDALFAVVAAGYGLGTLAGVALVSRLTVARWPATLVTAVLAVLALANLFAFAHPVWFVPAAAVLMGIGHCAGRALRPARTRPAA